MDILGIHEDICFGFKQASEVERGEQSTVRLRIVCLRVCSRDAAARMMLLCNSKTKKKQKQTNKQIQNEQPTAVLAYACMCMKIDGKPPPISQAKGDDKGNMMIATQNIMHALPIQKPASPVRVVNI